MADSLGDTQEDENTLEGVSIWISQQGCRFVKGCHTHDFGKQTVPDGRAKCYETGM